MVRQQGKRTNPALGIDAFEVANQQQPEVRPRRQTRAADCRRVEQCTLRFDERVKRMPVEYLIQSLIERMPARAERLIVPAKRGNRVHETPWREGGADR